MLNPIRSVLTGALWLSATAAMAQAAPPATELQKQADGFVKSYAASTAKIDQIARWGEPVCVQVTGLTPDKAADIKARVEDVAKAVGQRALPAGCLPNIEIVFSTQPQRVLDNIAARREVLLGYDHRFSKTLKTVSRPIQAWYVTATVGGGGPNAGAVFSASDSASDHPGSNGGVQVQIKERVMDDPDNEPPTGCGDSHFSACLRSEFDNVLVVVDLGRTRDKSVGLVSDYVTMLALSQPRSLDGCNGLPSVIDLFAPDCPGRSAPDGLTPADAAYLTSLYEADPEGNRASEQADIAGRMAKILVNAKLAAR